MGQKSKKKGDYQIAAGRPQNRDLARGSIRDLRFLTTVKVSPQAAFQILEKQVAKIKAPGAVLGGQNIVRVPVAQNKLKWSGKKMSDTKFSMFTKKTGLNTVMANKGGFGGLKIPALAVILAIVVGGGGYWAYSSLSSTEWGRMSSANETNKWLENVSTSQRNEAAPVKTSKTVIDQTESYKTWGSTSKKTKEQAKKHPQKELTFKKAASKKAVAKASGKSGKGKKIAASKKGKSKKFVKSKNSKASKKAKYVKGKAKKSKSKHIRQASSSR